MATLYITECNKQAMGGLAPSVSNAFPVSAPQMPPVAEQAIAIGGTSTQSAAFNAATSFVMVSCDVTCSLAWGTNPTAVATAQRMYANETRFYGVTAGQKLAVISNS